MDMKNAIMKCENIKKYHMAFYVMYWTFLYSLHQKSPELNLRNLLRLVAQDTESRSNVSLKVVNKVCFSRSIIPVSNDCIMHNLYALLKALCSETCLHDLCKALCFILSP